MGRELQGELNRLAGTVGLEAQGAANVIAGTTDLDMLGALNVKAGVRGMGLNGVCKLLASQFGGNSGLDAQGALASITAFSTFNPITAIGWARAYWTGGPEFLALGLTDGAAVSTWPDEISTGDLVQATGTKQPAYRTTGGPNSKPCIDFDGVSDSMAATITSITQPASVVILFTFDTNPQSGTSQRVIGSANWLLDNADPPTGKLRIFAGTVDTSDNVVFATGATHLVTGYYNGVTSVVDFDGALILSGAGWSPSTNAINSFTLGADPTGVSLFADIDVMFIGLYSGNVRLHAQWTGFKSWVASFYGLAIA
jgi:hypothetical protein